MTIYRLLFFLIARAIADAARRRPRPAWSTGRTASPPRRDESGDPNRSVHHWALLTDPLGVAHVWYFYPDLGACWIGLLQAHHVRAPGAITQSIEEYGWVQDATGNPYIGTVNDWKDPYTGYQRQSRREQSVDTHGNVIQTKIYDRGEITGRYTKQEVADLVDVLNSGTLSMRLQLMK